MYFSNPKPGQTTGGSGQDEAGQSGVGRGEAGPGGAGRVTTPAGCSPRKQTILLPSRECKTTVQVEASKTRSNEIPCKPLEELVESKTRTYHGRVETGRRTAGRRGGAELGSTGRRQVGPPRKQPPLLAQTIEDNLLQRVFGSTNKRNSIQSGGGKTSE